MPKKSAQVIYPGGRIGLNRRLSDLKEKEVDLRNRYNALTRRPEKEDERIRLVIEMGEIKDEISEVRASLASSSKGGGGKAA